MKRVFVTGAGGFCGRYLIQLLTKRGYQVSLGYHSHLPHSPFAEYRVRLENPTEISKVLKAVRPDYICHLAAQSNARLSWERADETFRSNVLGTLNLAKAVLAYTPHTRIVFASSTHVYGRFLGKSDAVSEKSRLWPVNPYGVSKTLSELGCLDLAHRSGLNLVIARSNNYFGAGQSTEYVFSDWCSQVAGIEQGKQEPIIRVGDLSLERDFLYVEDGMAAFELLMRKGKKGEIYNISSGRTLALRYYLNFLLSQSKTKIKVLTDKNRFRKHDPSAVRVSNDKLKSLGWKPRHSVTHALTELLNYWRKEYKKGL